MTGNPEAIRAALDDLKRAGEAVHDAEMGLFNWLVLMVQLLEEGHARQAREIKAALHSAREREVNG